MHLKLRCQESFAKSHFVSEFNSWVTKFFRKWYNMPGFRLFFLNGKLTYKLRTTLRYSLSLPSRRTLRYSVNLAYELRKSRLTEFVSEIYGIPLTELFVRPSYGVVYGVASLRIKGLLPGFSYGVVNGDFSLTEMFTKPRCNPNIYNYIYNKMHSEKNMYKTNTNSFVHQFVI